VLRAAARAEVQCDGPGQLVFAVIAIEEQHRGRGGRHAGRGLRRRRQPFQRGPPRVGIEHVAQGHEKSTQRDQAADGFALGVGARLREPGQQVERRGPGTLQ
jgi:hypothetical protein